MRIALIADTFPPMRTSGAVQLRDLAHEFTRQGHQLTIMLPSPDVKQSWLLEYMDDVQVLRLSTPRIKDISYLKRTIGEFLMPFAMRRNFLKSPLAMQRWDGIVWYAPSIFHGPFVHALQKASQVNSYLIIRDIFPEWAVDMGLMRRGIAYWFFSAVARYQYSVANIIGIQAEGNRVYFDSWKKVPGRRLEVLNNWLGRGAFNQCRIRVSDTVLAGRHIFVYAGNMGVAQGMDVILNLAVKMQARLDLGFLFVGRGSETQRLKDIARSRQLNNVLFFDEIDPDEIPDLYAQCSAGLVALDFRHKSHNIPGKFLTYMQSGLPVLATVNARNDLAELIRRECVGQVCESNQVDDLVCMADLLLNQLETDPDLSVRCRALFSREFSAKKAVCQIVEALSLV